MLWGDLFHQEKKLLKFFRQKSRPYLFSNSLAPSIVSASIKAIEILSSSNDLIEKLQNNTNYFRDKIKALGFDIKDGTHPIVPVMLYDAKLAQIFASKLLEKGIYVIGFFYPVVPQNLARIRVQISALQILFEKLITCYYHLKKLVKNLK